VKVFRKCIGRPLGEESLLQVDKEGVERSIMLVDIMKKLKRTDVETKKEAAELRKKWADVQGRLLEVAARLKQTIAENRPSPDEDGPVDDDKVRPKSTQQIKNELIQKAKAVCEDTMEKMKRNEEVS
jgi:hypothetical protein